MPLLTIHHKTEYRYARPVAFGEHRIMLRPRDGHDLRVLSSSLEIAPRADVAALDPRRVRQQRRDRDLRRARADAVVHLDRDRRAQSGGGVRADRRTIPPISIRSSTTTRNFPISQQFITPQYGDPNGELSAWARDFLDAEGPTPTFNILSGMTHGIREAFTYRKRHEHGTQHPLDTLQTGSGTCRDYALFMIEALRRLGIAARFVSGYLFIPGDRAHGYVGGGSTHAWVQVYLPSAGWIEFDPTNGIIGTRDLVRVAVARDPRQAIPLHGAYLGSADAFVGMEVSINVVSVGDEKQAEKV